MMQAELQARIQFVNRRITRVHWLVVLAGANKNVNGGGGERCFALQPLLPFGLAIYWAERLNQAWGSDKGNARMSPKWAGIREVLHWWLDALNADLQMWHGHNIRLLRRSEDDCSVTPRLLLEVIERLANSSTAQQDSCPQQSVLQEGWTDEEAANNQQDIRKRQSISWKALQGRSLLHAELERWMSANGVLCREGEVYTNEWNRTLYNACETGQVELTAGVQLQANGRLSCNRCGAGEALLHWQPCAACGYICPYCEQCLQLGRVRLCTPLVRGLFGFAEERRDRLYLKEGRVGDIHLDDAEPDLRKWGLSPAQHDAVERGLQFLKQAGGDCRRYDVPTEPPSFLIWAVTGAGKTEMVYPLIAYELARGGRVLVAAPRRDVVMELKPRLQRAFPQCRVIALYGGSEDTWKEGDLVLATTHQLMRFDRAFDLAIIDELDAFPYHNNPMLQHAARRALAKSGKRVWLSATPPVNMKKAARRNELPHALVYVRYHRHPLPLPAIVRTQPLHKWIKPPVRKHPHPLLRWMAKWRRVWMFRACGSMPSALYRAMQRSLQRGAQLFVFVPRIADAAPTASLLRTVFPDQCVESVHAQDAERTEKVKAFRRGEIRLLVSTTILERGVTVPRTDVFILDAHRSPFDATSLVQMAGRAGRSSDDPAGRVVFAAPYRNLAQWQAVREIRRMNRWAKRKGYLLERK